jgi:hypothetical protein
MLRTMISKNPAQRMVTKITPPTGGGAKHKGDPQINLGADMERPLSSRNIQLFLFFFTFE